MSRSDDGRAGLAPLAPAALARRADAARFTFATTADLEEPGELGQARAEAALRFGIELRRYGYNLFVLGPTGLGKQGFVRRFLEPRAAAEPVPDDWCYVHTFKDGQRPRALRLPPGRGAILRREVDHLALELRATLPAALETEDYRTRKKLLEVSFAEENERPFAELERRAEQEGVAFLRTPSGVALSAKVGKEVMPPEQFHALPEEEQARFKKKMTDLEEQLQQVAAELPVTARRQREALRQLDQEVAALAVSHLVDEVKARYPDLPEVLAYLDNLQQDVLENVDDFLSSGEQTLESVLAAGEGRRTFGRYEVNLLVDRSATKGAPVEYEDHPTAANLVGRVDHRNELGALVSDHRLIRAGALHRANGGYLILEARKVLQQPFAWEELKRALRSRQVRIESPAQMMATGGSVSVEPEPIPLDVKVVLMGERPLYNLLSEADPDFLELFKVAADLDDAVERTPGTEQGYAALLGGLARREGLRPLDPGGVARTIDHSCRLTGDAERLSLHADRLLDLLGEADHVAAQRGGDAIGGEDVRQAIDAHVHRSDRLRDRIQEEIRRGTILIDTGGGKVGQVNGLAVYQVGRFAFGRPNRITARVRLGNGRLLDIEREVALGGPIHSKGVLILSGFLGARYASDRPLALAATLVFEQSYGGVDGDSASCAELLALLSAVAEVPIRQSLAVTGSVNQQGEVQPVGGVNDKIEGFFDVCRARGLTGEQGVLIPSTNVKHLMLREDVVQEAAEGRFHVWAVDTIDQAIEIATGLPAGERGPGTGFPAGSFNQRVEQRLAALAERARAFAPLRGELER